MALSAADTLSSDGVVTKKAMFRGSVVARKDGIDEGREHSNCCEGGGRAMKSAYIST